MANTVTRRIWTKGLPIFKCKLGVMAAVLVMAIAILCPVTSAQAAATPITCADTTLQEGLMQGSAAYINAAVANTRSIFESSPRSDIRNTQCLGSGFFRYFDLIRAILSGINAMVVAINMLVTSIIQMICSYITNAITNLINSALSLLCIPSLPGLNLNFGLPSLSSRACNGTPLLQFETGYGMSMPGSVPSFMNNMSRGIPGSGGSFRF